MPEQNRFIRFTAEEAKAYATGRGFSYPPEIYNAVLDYHRSSPSSPSFNYLLDVGCGPGKVAFDLSSAFAHAVGADPSVQMIEAAKADPRYVEDNEKIDFVVCRAEEIDGLGLGEEEGGVDVITVAMAAHWFDMPAFYASAAKALKPGGTLAMWTCTSTYCHPSDPDYKALQTILSHLENDILMPHATAGTLLTRDAYKNLPLPWTLDEPCPHFPQSSFVRKDWDLDGVPSARLEDGSPGPFVYDKEVTPKQLGAAFNGSSLVIRWREANREALEKGEVEDCIEAAIKGLEKVLRNRESKGFKVCPSSSMLLTRRG